MINSIFCYVIHLFISFRVSSLALGRWTIWASSIVSNPWWRHQMETFYALLALCRGNPPVSDGFPSQRPVARRFDVFFDQRLHKKLNKQSRCGWFETPSRSIWRHCNAKMGFLKRSSKPFLIWDVPMAKIVDKGILQESIVSEIPIHVYHGLFAPNNSKETPILDVLWVSAVRSYSGWRFTFEFTVLCVVSCCMVPPYIGSI